jgi:hypothetical protein
MKRREMILALGGSALSLTALSTLTAADHHRRNNPHADHCAKACADCMVDCAKDLQHCLAHLAGGRKEYAKCAELCAGCYQLCNAALSCCHSSLAPTGAEASAKACELCAAECEKFPNDEVMKVCATSCRDCASACRALVKAS